MPHVPWTGHVTRPRTLETRHSAASGAHEDEPLNERLVHLSSHTRRLTSHMHTVLMGCAAGLRARTSGLIGWQHTVIEGRGGGGCAAPNNGIMRFRRLVGGWEGTQGVDRTQPSTVPHLPLCPQQIAQTRAPAQQQTTRAPERRCCAVWPGLRSPCAWAAAVDDIIGCP